MPENAKRRRKKARSDAGLRGVSCCLAPAFAERQIIPIQ
ncbi:hypothetical protein EBME_0695 [bacterium endosymbiont of Mortierella elongata FMR23-6]|nr:hypothetical protein EBME_0695 [bacterium endosymbiont of Mortierella elongata FMR23-6]